MLYILRLCIILMLLNVFKNNIIRIQGESMSPTLEESNYYETSRINGINDIKRGDIVTFKWLDFRVVKRVVGLPGDKIEFIEVGDNTTLVINGQPIDEMKEWGLDTMIGYYETPPPTTVRENCIYVLGDNRTGSTDSRIFGDISEEYVVDKVNLGKLPKWYYYLILNMLFVLFLYTLYKFLNLILIEDIQELNNI